MTTTKDPGAGQHNIYIRKEKKKRSTVPNGETRWRLVIGSKVTIGPFTSWELLLHRREEAN